MPHDDGVDPLAGEWPNPPTPGEGYAHALDCWVRTSDKAERNGVEVRALLVRSADEARDLAADASSAVKLPHAKLVAWVRDSLIDGCFEGVDDAAIDADEVLACALEQAAGAVLWATEQLYEAVRPGSTEARLRSTNERFARSIYGSRLTCRPLPRSPGRSRPRGHRPRSRRRARAPTRPRRSPDGDDEADADADADRALDDQDLADSLLARLGRLGR